MTPEHVTYIEDIAKCYLLAPKPVIDEFRRAVYRFAKEFKPKKLKGEHKTKISNGVLDYDGIHLHAWSFLILFRKGITTQPKSGAWPQGASDQIGYQISVIKFAKNKAQGVSYIRTYFALISVYEPETAEKLYKQLQEGAPKEVVLPDIPKESIGEPEIYENLIECLPSAPMEQISGIA